MAEINRVEKPNFYQYFRIFPFLMENFFHLYWNLFHLVSNSLENRFSLFYLELNHCELFHCGVVVGTKKIYFLILWLKL